MNCEICQKKIPKCEIYGDWYYCKRCDRNYYHRERLNPEDHIVEANEMVCDSPNSENKESPRDIEKSISANCNCIRCSFPKQNAEKTKRLYCECD